MATMADIVDAVAAALSALPGITGRLDADYRDELGGLAPGETRYALRADLKVSDRSADSNTVHRLASLEVQVAHWLADDDDERAYSGALRFAHQRILTDGAFWRGIAGVKDVFEGPEVDPESTRVGSVISYTVAVRLRFVD